MPDYREEFLDIVNENGEPDRLLLLHIRSIRYDGTSAEVGTRMNIIKDVNIEEPLPRLIEKAKQFMSIQLREFTALDTKTGLFRTQPE